MGKIAVIGGGAAGMFAAVNAAGGHNEVDIYDHNEKLGKKLYITGKGRCNVTNACEDTEEMLSHVVSNPRFLYSAFSAFGSRQMMEFLDECGVRLTTERGQRVFPASGKSSDIIRALTDALKKKNVRIHLNTEVEGISAGNGKVTGIKLAGGGFLSSDAVILATGGMSYPSTGSRGDGYRMAKSLGHTVTDPSPSLVPMVSPQEWVKSLSGLSLKNIGFSLSQKDRIFFRDFGEMMFTHFGITGPVVLTGSTRTGTYLKNGPVTAAIDLKPALTEEQLDARIIRDFGKYINRHLCNALSDLLPSSLIPVIISLSGNDPHEAVHDITREERLALVRTIKHLTVTVTGLRGWDEAVITRGGISVKDVWPGTMESRKIKGLYFAGEVLDVDAETGGFNLQIAWSTGYMAGRAASEEISGDTN